MTGNLIASNPDVATRMRGYFVNIASNSSCDRRSPSAVNTTEAPKRW
jgi:hypothetical protein